MHLRISNLVVVVTSLSVVGATATGESPFKIIKKRDNDKVEVRVEEAKAVISVRSPFGISQAVIERKDKDWPDIVMLRLHLKGLENFKVTNGKVTLEAAVSSQDGKVRYGTDDKEGSALDAKNSYWTVIRMVGKDEKPVKSIPLDDGYFELQLPKALFEGNPNSITVNWIDFYR